MSTWLAWVSRSRDGSDFGLPETVKPISGHIGHWTRDGEGALAVTLDTADLLSG